MAIQRTCLLLFSFTFLCTFAMAQERVDNTAPGSGNLPIGLTAEEKALQHLIGLNRDITPPPLGPRRLGPRAPRGPEREPPSTTGARARTLATSVIAAWPGRNVGTTLAGTT